MSMRSHVPAHDVDPLRIWFRFIRLNRRATNAVATELKELGLSIPQFDLLSTLTEREGMSQQELAERLYVTKGNVSGLLDRMVEAGLVERRSIPGDRRSNALYPDPEGPRPRRAAASPRSSAYVMRHAWHAPCRSGRSRAHRPGLAATRPPAR